MTVMSPVTHDLCHTTATTTDGAGRPHLAVGMAEQTELDVLDVSSALASKEVELCLADAPPADPDLDVPSALVSKEVVLCPPVD